MNTYRDRVEQVFARLDEAERGPTGSWRQRFVPGVCKHEKVRCVHGDEIIFRKGRRCACLICGRSLTRPLPEVCFFTGGRH